MYVSLIDQLLVVNDYTILSGDGRHVTHEWPARRNEKIEGRGRETKEGVAASYLMPSPRNGVDKWRVEDTTRIKQAHSEALPVEVDFGM